MKSKTIAIVLAVLFGGLGIHKFYLGRPAAGMLYLLFCWTFIPLILSLVDAVLYLLMSRDTFNDRYNWLRLSTMPGYSPARR